MAGHGSVAMVPVCCVALLLAVGFMASSSVDAASPAQWKSRTIYQLLTDRFATSDGSTSPCADLSDYCGGSFQGIVDHLDYIAGMGFDAIWISPIPVNTPGGYHGYWLMDLYNINPHFGTAGDLTSLINECHKRGIWVMLDIVANHVGNAPISQISPFDQQEYYHDCSSCPSQCSISDYTCFQSQVQTCRLAGLPDLNQTVPFVSNALLQWINKTVKTYGFDGLRIDTVPEVAPDFWRQFEAAASVYSVGEVESSLDCCVAYQQQALSGILSYPLFWTLRNVFQSKGSMYQLQDLWGQYQQFPDVNALGTFVDNHDHPRFLNGNSDQKLYENALLHVLMSTGIPIVYYGTEQAFAGGNDPGCREPLWPSKFDNETSLYTFLQTVISFRKKAQVWNYPQVQRYADDSFYAFTRGTTFVAMTNAGSNSGGTQRTITYHPYASGTRLCNLFFPTTDCLTVQNGQFDVYLLNGECKVYHPV